MASELYFRHIIDARKHIKIYQLEKQFGRHIAYAYYFKTLELMAELSECGLKTANLQDYSEYLQIDNDTFNQFIQYCVEIDLFNDHDGLITAERLIENMQKIKSKSINMSKAAIRREKLKAKQQHNSATILPQTEQKKEMLAPVPDFIQSIFDLAIKENTGKPSNRKWLLTQEHLDKLKEGYSDSQIKEQLTNYYYWKVTTDKPKPIKSDYMSILTAREKGWIFKEVKQQGKKPYLENGTGKKYENVD